MEKIRWNLCSQIQNIAIHWYSSHEEWTAEKNRQNGYRWRMSFDDYHRDHDYDLHRNSHPHDYLTRNRAAEPEGPERVGARHR